MSAKRTKGSTATVAEITSAHVPEQPIATEPAPASSETPVSTPATDKAIVLIDSRLTQLTDSWSKTETRDAREVVTFAIENMVKAAECKMAVGKRFNDFSEKHGDKVNVLVKETAKLGLAGLTESNIALWRIRAKMFPEFFPNAKVRKYVLAISGGEGVIIRDESFDEKDADGKPKPKPYILSPYWSEAIKTIGPVPTSDNEEVAELWSRKTASHATFLRSKARTAPVESRIQKRFRDFTKWVCSDGTIGKNEQLVYACLKDMLQRVVNETEDLDRAEDLDAFLANIITGKEEVNDQKNGKMAPQTTAAAKTATAAKAGKVA